MIKERISAPAQMENGSRYRDLLRISVFTEVLGPSTVELLRAILGERTVYRLMKVYILQKNLSKKRGKPLNFQERLTLLEEESLLQEIERFYYESFPHLKKRGDLATHLATVRKRADVIVDHIRELAFPGSEDTFSHLNQTQPLKSNPLYSAVFLSANGQVDNRLKFELQRQELITLIILQLDEIKDSSQQAAKASQLQQLFHDELHHPDEKEGETTQVAAFSLHDRDTNRVVSIEYIEPTAEPPLGFYWKKNIIRTHSSGDGLRFMEHHREKSDSSAVAKSLTMSLLPELDGLVSANSVEDGHGCMFVAFNAEDQLRLYQKIQLTIYLHAKELGLVSIEPDHKVDKGRGQSSSVRWLRMIAYFDQEKSNPIEIVVFNIEDYLNYKYDFTGGPEKAQAHALYEQRRIAEVAKILFSYHIQDPSNDYDIEEAEALRTREAVGKIFSENRFYTAAERADLEPDSFIGLSMLRI